MPVHVNPIVFASTNSGKLTEVRAVAVSFGVHMLSPTELGLSHLPIVEENEATYSGNARLKALSCHRWCGKSALGDDTGLECMALRGAPGVYSARYAGEPQDAKRNREKLLSVLSKKTDRRALFRCVLFLKTSSFTLTAEGILQGTIARESEGTGGFGYDSVFIPDGFKETLASIKEKPSSLKTHRTLALEKLFQELQSK